MISRSTAIPAAHEIGLPSNVCPSTKPGFWAIGPQKASAIVPTANHRRKRCIAAGESLGDAEHVGRDSEGLGREHPAGAADPGDDLIEDQEDVMAVADLAKNRQILFGRVDHAAGVADRLDQDGRHGRGIFHLDHVAHDRRAGDAAIGVGLAEGAAVACRRKNMKESRCHGLVHRLARFEPRCRERAKVEPCHDW